MHLRTRIPRQDNVLPASVPKRRYQKKKFAAVINSINFEIAALLTKQKKYPVCKFKTEIPESFRQYLSHEFGIRKRFYPCRELLNAFMIVRSNQVDCNTRLYINEESFSVKINNTRHREIHSIYGLQKFASSASITIRFTRMREHQFNHAALDILARFESRNN